MRQLIWSSFEILLSKGQGKGVETGETDEEFVLFRGGRPLSLEQN